MINYTTELYDKAYAWIDTLNDYSREMIERIGTDNWEELGSDYGYNIEEYDSFLPVWGTMWQYTGELHYDEEEFVEMLLECGFRVYKDEELGLFFGVQGYGYSFMSEHWVPLYKKFFGYHELDLNTITVEVKHSASGMYFNLSIDDTDENTYTSKPNFSDCENCAKISFINGLLKSNSKLYIEDEDWITNYDLRCLCEEETEEIPVEYGVPEWFESKFDCLKNGTDSEKLFANTVEELSAGQGFYGRFIRDVNEMSDEKFMLLRTSINAANLKDRVDVVMMLEN